jgi:fructokinase
MITSVGKDAHGDSVRTTMQAWGMDMSGVHVSEQYPTGQVAVNLQDGQPSYDIVTGQAYDHISEQVALAAMGDQPPALLYHGSLALRENESRATLDALLPLTNGKSEIPIFLDLNLRAPWWEMSLLEKILQRATWVKLNDEELCEVTRHPFSNGPELQGYAQELFENCQLERLIVTRGAQGAFVLSKEGLVEGQPVPVKNVVDTVGAGDAFSAVTIMGLLHGWATQETLNRALAFASAICQQRGATAQNLDLYRQ